MSEYFKANRQEYYDRLSAAHGKDDLEGWLRFFMKGVTETSRVAGESARMVLALRDNETQAAMSLGAESVNAIKLLNHLYGNPYVRIKDVEAITGLSNPNAIALIARMSRLGILAEITGRKRNKVFAHVPYLELFKRQ